MFVWRYLPCRKVPGVVEQPSVAVHVVHAVPDVATARELHVEPAEQAWHAVSALAVQGTVYCPATHELALQEGQSAFEVPKTLKVPAAQATHTASAVVVPGCRR